MFSWSALHRLITTDAARFPRSGNRVSTRRPRLELLTQRRLLTANAPPTFQIDDVTVNEDSGASTIAGFIRDFDPGPGEDGASDNVQTLYDENATADTTPLSNISASPTDLGTLIHGSNLVSGFLETAQDTLNVDVFSFTVPDGFQLDQLFVRDYAYIDSMVSPNERNAFLAINDGNSFPFDVFDLDINVNPDLDETQFLGGTIFGLDDLSGANDGAPVDILPRAGVITGRRFTPPLAAGVYTFYIQQTGPANTYTLDLRVTSIDKQVPIEFNVGSPSDPSLFITPPTIDVDGNLRFRVAPDANGTATFEVTARDSGGTENGGQDVSDPRTATIHVQAVNDRPTFTADDPPPTSQGSGPQTIAGFITSVELGPDDESDQSVTEYRVSNFSNPEFFNVNPVIDIDGTLTYTPRPDLVGEVSFEITVTDDGGTENGGNDTSSPQTFTISVTPPPITIDVDFVTDLVAATDRSTVASVDVSASGDGFVDGWIDFNDDGDWDDAGEHVVVGAGVSSGTNRLPIIVPVIANIASGANVGSFATRFRVGDQAASSPSDPADGGQVDDGQVEVLDAATAQVVRLRVEPSSVRLETDASGLRVLETSVSPPTVLFASPLLPTALVTIAESVQSPSFSFGFSSEVPIIQDADQYRMGDAFVSETGLVRSITGVEGSAISLEIVTPTAWQNVLQAGDVNNDGEVTASDALRIINELGRREFSDRQTNRLDDPESLAAWPGVYVDHNGDGDVTALDALRVINELARTRLAESEAGWTAIAIDDWHRKRAGLDGHPVLAISDAL